MPDPLYRPLNKTGQVVDSSVAELGHTHLGGEIHHRAVHEATRYAEVDGILVASSDLLYFQLSITRGLEAAEGEQPVGEDYLRILSLLQ